MDFLKNDGKPWRITIDRGSELAAPDAVLTAYNAITFRVNTPYTEEEDFIAESNKGFTRSKVAALVRKHIRPIGKKITRDCFLMDVTVSEEDDMLYIVTINCAEEIGQPSWAEAKLES